MQIRCPQAQIAVVKHWIDVGAPLDAGVTLTADLFDVMPEKISRCHQPNIESPSQ